MPFQRASIDLLGDIPAKNNSAAAVYSLPDLVRFCAERNAEHTFLYQQTSYDSTPTNITFGHFAHVVDRCCRWLRDHSSIMPRASSRHDIAPVALLLESDYRSFAMIVALLWLDIPCLLLSIRLSPVAVNHLMQDTNATCIIVSPRTADLASAAMGTATQATVLQAPASESLLAPFESGSRASILDQYVDCKRDIPGVIILHSSGTTGLPKPIRLAHRYLLGYAACHTLPSSADCEGVNVSTLPIFHGFGLLGPCLALAVGMPCCLPTSSSLPTGRSILDLVQKMRASSVMTVPSILEDMVSDIETAGCSDKDLKLLSSLRFIAVGGGSMSLSLGEWLAAHSVRLLNHYGATEIGPLAPIFIPGKDYDWRYLRLRNDMGLCLRADETDRNETSTIRSCRLVGYPFGWNAAFELQDELEMRPNGVGMEVRILGRKDDLVVLATGEKVRPHQLEQAVLQCPEVKQVVACGSGCFELSLLVEPLTYENLDVEEFVDKVWSYAKRGNALMDAHAQITSPAAIIVKPRTRPLPTTDKGSIKRKEVEALFQDELKVLYERLESSGRAVSYVSLNPEHLEDGIANLLQDCLPQHKRSKRWDYDSDIFELGIDSLQCARLTRALRSSASELNIEIARSFPYRFNTVAKMAAAMRKPDHFAEATIQRGEAMQSMVARLMADHSTTPKQCSRATVLLTGSTGSVGAHVLEQLCQDTRVSRIICLYRRSTDHERSADRPNGHVDQGALRQRSANALYAIDPVKEASSHVEYLEWNTTAPNLGLCADDYNRLTANITHIIHCAWPMDFNRTLESFEPHVQAVNELCQLALLASQQNSKLRPRLMVMSSIAAIGHYTQQTKSRLIPEAVQGDPLVALPIGYAEGKWVCEQLCERLSVMYRDQIDIVVLRLGQITGSSKTGYWNPKEHLPLLFQAAQKIGRMPMIDGSVSWLPIDATAATIIDVAFQAERPIPLILNVENPVRIPWSDVIVEMISQLSLENGLTLPLDEWLRVASSNGLSSDLMEFYEHHFKHMATGFKMDTRKAQLASTTLRSVTAPNTATLATYSRFFRECGICT